MKLPVLRYEPPPIYFMHIPKTAGSSLRLLFKAAYREQAIVQLYRQGTHRFTAAEMQNFRCISSHWGPGLLPFLPQPGVACLTLLRDPIEQFVSHLYFRQKELNQQPHLFQPSYLAQMQPLLQADLRTLLESPIPMLPDNLQTRYLGSVEDVRPYFKDGMHGQKGPALHGLPFSFSTALDLGQTAAHAHRQVEQMAVVGVTERFAESVLLVCDFLGIAMPAQMPLQNIGPQKRAVAIHGYRAALSPDLLDLIMAKTQVDQELYAHACALVEMKVAQQRTRLVRTYSIAPRLRLFIQRVKGKGHSITANPKALPAKRVANVATAATYSLIKKCRNGLWRRRV